MSFSRCTNFENEKPQQFGYRINLSLQFRETEPLRPSQWKPYAAAWQAEHQIKKWTRRKNEALIRGDFDELKILAVHS